MNKINAIIKTLEKPCFPFKPNENFYKSIGMKRKRWAQILRNEKSPDLEELNRIAEFFKVDVKTLI